MRRILPLLAAMAVLACGDAVSGTYQFVSISGTELPAPDPLFPTSTVTSGSLTLTSDSTFTVTVTSYEADGDPETESQSGTFTLDESNVIHFNPESASDDHTPFEGTWDGDQITVKVTDDITLVFRR